MKLTQNRKNIHIVYRIFKLKYPMLCDSFYLIDVIICPGCNEEYIGETGLGKSN